MNLLLKIIANYFNHMQQINYKVQINWNIPFLKRQNILRKVIQYGDVWVCDLIASFSSKHQIYISIIYLSYLIGSGMPRESKFLRNVSEKNLQIILSKYELELQDVGWKKKHKVWGDITKELQINNSEKNRKNLHTKFWRIRNQDQDAKQGIPIGDSENMSHLIQERIQSHTESRSGSDHQSAGTQTPPNEQEHAESLAQSNIKNNDLDISCAAEGGDVSPVLHPIPEVDSMFGLLLDSTDVYSSSKLLQESSQYDEEISRSSDNNNSETIQDINELLGSSTELDKNVFFPGSQFGKVKEYSDINIPSLDLKFESEGNVSTKEQSVISGSNHDLEYGNLLSDRTSDVSLNKNKKQMPLSVSPTESPDKNDDNDELYEPSDRSCQSVNSSETKTSPSTDVNRSFLKEEEEKEKNKSIDKGLKYGKEEIRAKEKDSAILSSNIFFDDDDGLGISPIKSFDKDSADEDNKTRNPGNFEDFGKTINL